MAGACACLKLTLSAHSIRANGCLLSGGKADIPPTNTTSVLDHKRHARVQFAAVQTGLKTPFRPSQIPALITSLEAVGVLLTVGKAMRRRSRTISSKAAARRGKPPTVRGRGSSAPRQETEVARLTRELKQAREQQTATGDVLKVISRSAFDLQAVLDTLVKSAARLCEADMVSINRPRDGAMYFAANFGLPQEFEEIVKRTSFVPGRGTVVGRVLLAGKPVQIADVKADPEYTFTEGQRVAGFRTSLGVPREREGETIGVIVLVRTKVQPFTEKQIELVQNFAAQAVIAIENARLLNELRQSLEQQTATADVLRVISSSPGELDPVFNAMLENATRICGANFGGMFRFEDSALRLIAKIGLPQKFFEALQSQAHRPGPLNAVSRLIRTQRPVHIADYSADEAYLSGDPMATIGVELGGIRTLLNVPMVKDGELVGFIGIFRQEAGPFTDKQIALVQSFAAQAVIAIENTRLLNELRQSLEQQTATADVLRVISSSPGELEPVFGAMLENATRICEATSGLLVRAENDGFQIVASWHQRADIEDMKHRTFKFGPSTPIGRAVRSRQMVHVANLAEDRAYLEREPLAVRAVEQATVRTVLVVPMLKEEELIGVFGIEREEVKPFTEKANPAGDDLCGPGRHRHRERAIAR